jgi:hypothetical protein
MDFHQTSVQLQGDLLVLWYLLIFFFTLALILKTTYEKAVLCGLDPLSYFYDFA